MTSMFDEKVNIEAEPINDFLYFLGKFPGKQQQTQQGNLDKYDDINSYQTSVQPLPNAPFTYKPRNVQLLEKIKKETEEKEKNNDPYFSHRFHKQQFNKFNDLGNYTQINNNGMVNNNNNNNLYSQSVQGQQQFITANDGLLGPHGQQYKNIFLPIQNNNKDLMQQKQPQFGQSSFNFGEQNQTNQINRRQGISFLGLNDHNDSNENQFNNNIQQQQQQIFNNISKDINNINNKSSDKNMELEDQQQQQQNLSQPTPLTEIVNGSNNIQDMEQENDTKNEKQSHKKRDNPLKKVMKKKLISKATDYKLRPTRSSIADKDEQISERLLQSKSTKIKSKNHIKHQQQQNKKQQQQYHYENDRDNYYNNNDDEDDYEDDAEEFILYKKAKRMQVIPNKMKARKQSQYDNGYVKQNINGNKINSNKKQERILSSQSYQYDNDSGNNNINNRSFSNQRNHYQINTQSTKADSNPILKSSQSQSSQQQTQNLVGLQNQLQQQQSQQQFGNQQNNNNINLQQQQQQVQYPIQQQQQQVINPISSFQWNPQNQQPQQQQQQQQQQLQQNDLPQLQQNSSQLEEQNNNDNILQLLPLPKSKNSVQWELNKNKQNNNLLRNDSNSINSQQNLSDLSLFDLNKYQHQNISLTSKLNFDLYDENQQQGYTAHVIKSQNTFIMPHSNNVNKNKLTQLDGSRQNSEEKKEDKTNNSPIENNEQK